MVPDRMPASAVRVPYKGRRHDRIERVRKRAADVPTSNGDDGSITRRRIEKKMVEWLRQSIRRREFRIGVQTCGTSPVIY